MEASWRHSGNVFRTVLFLCYGFSEVVLCEKLLHLCVCCFSPNIHPYSHIHSHLHIAKRKKALEFFLAAKQSANKMIFQFAWWWRNISFEDFFLWAFIIVRGKLVGNVNGENLVWKWEKLWWWAFYASRTWLRVVLKFFNDKNSFYVNFY